MDKMDIALVAILLPVLGWLRDNWFQSLAVLFMSRVWFGIGDLIDQTKGVEAEICRLRAVTERVEGCVYQLTPSHRKMAALMNQIQARFDDGPTDKAAGG